MHEVPAYSPGDLVRLTEAALAYKVIDDILLFPFFDKDTRLRVESQRGQQVYFNHDLCKVIHYGWIERVEECTQ